MKINNKNPVKKNKNFIKIIHNASGTFIVTKWSFKHRIFYRTMIPILKNIVPTLFNLEIFGRENLLQFPPEQPLILVSNHRSHLDSLVGFATIFPPKGNKLYVTTITNSDALKENFIFKMMRFLGSYPLEKHKSDQSLEYLYQTLQAGLSVAIFPQGGRIVRTPVEDYQNLPKEGRTGVGRIVLRTHGHIPVIPAYMHGTAEALPRGSIKPKFTSYISLRIGKPLYFNQYANKTFDQTDKEFFIQSRIITNQIMIKIQELCNETEKDLFTFLEQKFSKKIEDIILTDPQRKKLSEWLQKYSYYAPYKMSD